METMTGRGGRAFVTGADSRHLIGRDHHERPICPVTGDQGSVTWLVTGYDAAGDVLRDSRLSRAAASARLTHRGPALRNSVTEMDPPEHTRVRRLISKAFSARRIERLRPDLERTAEALLDTLVTTPPPVGLRAAFCAPLTFDAQCQVLGVPAGHRDALRALSVRRTAAADASPGDVQAAEEDLHEYVTGVLGDTDPAPGGLFADLIAACRTRELISERELTGIAASLFFDGHLLTASQIANTVLHLLTLPRPEHDIVEELLRSCPSVTMSMPRVVTEDMELSGVRVHAGDTVLVALPLVNRDRGEKGHHLSFGHGMHYCLGAHLARTLTRVAIAALTRRLPGMALAVSEDELEWYVTPATRSVRELPITWG